MLQYSEFKASIIARTSRTKGKGHAHRFFFRSLSEDQKEKAIGIIVSGTASVGTLGFTAIKGDEGMAMVQDPATAEYDG